MSHFGTAESYYYSDVLSASPTCVQQYILMMIDEKTIKTLLIYVAYLPIMSSCSPFSCDINFQFIYSSVQKSIYEKPPFKNVYCTVQILTFVSCLLSKVLEQNTLCMLKKEKALLQGRSLDDALGSCGIGIYRHIQQMIKRAVRLKSILLTRALALFLSITVFLVFRFTHFSSYRSSRKHTLRACSSLSLSFNLIYVYLCYFCMFYPEWCYLTPRTQTTATSHVSCFSSVLIIITIIILLLSNQTKNTLEGQFCCAALHQTLCPFTGMGANIFF